MKATTTAEDLERVCPDCRSTFVISSREAGWFLINGLAVPRRCHECRQRRRQERQDAERATALAAFKVTP